MYIETIAVGESAPDMPLFLAPEAHVMIPLERTYMDGRLGHDTRPLAAGHRLSGDA